MWKPQAAWTPAPAAEVRAHVTCQRAADNGVRAPGGGGGGGGGPGAQSGTPLGVGVKGGVCINGRMFLVFGTFGNSKPVARNFESSTTCTGNVCFSSKKCAPQQPFCSLHLSPAPCACPTLDAPPDPRLLHPSHGPAHSFDVAGAVVLSVGPASQPYCVQTFILANRPYPLCCRTS